MNDGYVRLTAVAVERFVYVDNSWCWAVCAFNVLCIYIIKNADVSFSFC